MHGGIPTYAFMAFTVTTPYRWPLFEGRFVRVYSAKQDLDWDSEDQIWRYLTALKVNFLVENKSETN
jgi:hypothetical protein